MSEKLGAWQKTAIGVAAGTLALTACGSSKEGVNNTANSAEATAAQTPPSQLTPPEFTPPAGRPSAPEVSPSALPRDILSGKGSALVCRGIAVIQAPEGFRTVANPIIDPTTKQVLFTEDASSAGITVDAERDSDQAAAWYNLQGDPHTLAGIPCKNQTIYTHNVTPPAGKGVTVVTTSPSEFSGTTRLDLHALQGPNGLVDQDFGIESQVAMTERLEQLAGITAS